MDWKAIADLALAGFSNVLVLAMMAVMSGAFAIKLLAFSRPAVEPRKESKPASTAPGR